MFSTQGRTHRSVLGALAALLLTAAAAAPVASAKTYKASFNASAPVDSATGKINGSASGKPLGKCKLTGKLQPPKAILKLSCKGGSLNLTANSTTGASNDVKGNWTINGGSGKFKKAKGKGTYSGKISTTKFKYVGSISY